MIGGNRGTKYKFPNFPALGRIANHKGTGRTEGRNLGEKLRIRHKAKRLLR